MEKERVVVLGASPNPERYSNRAVQMLLKHGHEVVPVNPRGDEVHGLTAVRELSELNESVDTLTVYVGPHAIDETIDQIVDMKPGRVILNPGTESDNLKSALNSARIPYEEACTLVLLSTGAF